MSSGRSSSGPVQALLTASGDALFGARSAVLAAYTAAMIGTFDVECRLRGEGSGERRAPAYMRRYGRDMSRVMGALVVTSGIGPSGFVPGADAGGMGRLFISNHRSGLDILVTLAHLEGRLVSRADLAKWPVIGPAARRAGILFVDRENRRSAAAVVQTMITTIEGGSGIVLFAEGTTYAGDEVRPFKPGALAVARRTGCEVVPVGLAYAGSGSSFDEETFLQHMRRVGSNRETRVGLAVGDPFRVDRGGDAALLTNLARARVQDRVHAARALVGS